MTMVAEVCWLFVENVREEIRRELFNTVNQTACGRFSEKSKVRMNEYILVYLNLYAYCVKNCDKITLE